MVRIKDCFTGIRISNIEFSEELKDMYCTMHIDIFSNAARIDTADDCCIIHSRQGHGRGSASLGTLRILNLVAEADRAVVVCIRMEGIGAVVIIGNSSVIDGDIVHGKFRRLTLVDIRGMRQQLG